MRKNKFTFIILICLILVFTTGCLGNNKQTETLKESDTSTEPTTAEELSVSTENTAKNFNEFDWNAIMPGMDGSTSAIPLEAGAKAELLGITHSEAMKLVNHTKTHESFAKLLNGEIDLIFSVPLSEEQQNLADESGFELESIPVAMEGFVFVVNIDNPIDTLSSEEIKKIYSGEITNWKEVGGLDEPIIAYQRNQDSGSQNYMVEFMDGLPLMEVPTELVPGFMGGMMDAVSVYDNSRQAIGYSVYSYAAQMYANANQVKFIKVDGIEPSKQTFSDKTYPLLSRTYIFFDKSLPDDSNVRVFADWMTSGEGQYCVLKNGYVPVMDMEIPAEYLPYLNKGTGAEKPADYAPSERVAKAEIDGVVKLEDDITFINEPDTYRAVGIYVDSLADKDLEAEINAWLEQAMEEIMPYSPFGKDSWAQWKEKYLYSFSDYDKTLYSYADFRFIRTDLYSRFTCINGYLSILIGYKENCPYFTEDAYQLVGEYSEHFIICRTAVFDLINGKKVENFSDLFYKDVDFLPTVNNNITKFISDYDEKAYPGAGKISYSGLLGDVEYFTFDEIILEPDNPYFYCGTELNYNSEQLKDSCVIWEYRDLSGLFMEKDVYDNEWNTNKNAHLTDENAPKYITDKYLHENGAYYNKVTYSRFIGDDKIEKMNNDLMVIQDIAAEQGFTYPYVDMELSNMYCVDFSRTSFEKRLYFDKDTLELLTPDDLFVSGWRDIAEYEEGCFPEENDEFIGYIDYDGICSIYFGHEIEDNAITYYVLKIPVEYINERYRD